MTAICPTALGLLQAWAPPRGFGGSAEKGLNPCRMNEWTKQLSEVTITLSHIHYVRVLLSH